MKNSTKEFFCGIKNISPALVGIIPLGAVLGFAMRHAGLNGVQGTFHSLSMIAKASQFAAIQLYSDLTPALIIILTVFMVNLRYSMYSLSFRAVMKDRPFAERLFASFLLTDLAYGYIMTEFEKRPEDPLLPSLYFGVATAIYLASQVGIFLGYNIGNLLASRNFLDFVIPLIFMALLAPHLGGRDRQLAAVSSAIFSIILVPSLPLRSGLLISMLIGITVGIAYNTLATKRNDNKRKKGENILNA